MGSYAPEDIFLIGESAGGTLSLCLPVLLRDRGIPLPRAVYLNSPAAQMADYMESYYRYSLKEDFIVTLGILENLRGICFEEKDAKSPYVSPLCADLRLDAVSFGYGDRLAVEGVSAVIPQGKITAIIGPNGSGKSTLIKLIDRLYSAERGEVRMGKISASDASLKAWREQFGMVSQNASLFSGSIRANICYGIGREVSEEELRRVVKLANLEDVIDDHDGGLDYEIGIKGTGLSGGEQQRVAIARALLKNPNVLILDEATANLDAKTEAEVKKGLLELMKGRTVIEIAHNYSAIQDADYVIVLNHGRMAGSGTPAELEISCGFFRQFVQER